MSPQGPDALGNCPCEYEVDLQESGQTQPSLEVNMVMRYNIRRYYSYTNDNTQEALRVYGYPHIIEGLLGSKCHCCSQKTFI